MGDEENEGNILCTNIFGSCGPNPVRILMRLAFQRTKSLVYQ